MDKETKDMFNLILQKLDGMDKRFDAMDVRLDGMDKRFDAMDARLDGMDKRFDAMDERLDIMDEKIDAMNTELRYVRVRLENEIAENIKRVAEGHMDLSRNLHEAMKPQTEIEMLVIRVNSLETKVRDLQHKVSIIS
ncbi:MAG TPA: hypothetical protein H9744_00950 [Candidatus Eisenbergiella stercoravium]|nr:hypothetical protein [Candidatus Eisenbergiella stercoravium]